MFAAGYRGQDSPLRLLLVDNGPTASGWRVAMAWFGGISAVVAIVAIGVVVWLWRQLEAERTHARDALYTRIDAENQLDALRAAQGAKTEANVALSEVLARLD